MQPTGNDFAVPESTAEEILLSEYDLRGLVEPRCPECGYTFDWAELRDPTRRRHPYLFEHHPERNVGSLIRTFISAMRPRTFWSVLYPTQLSNPRRLMIYWAVIASMWLLFCVADVGRAVYLADASNRNNRAMTARWLTPADSAQIVQSYGSIAAWQDVSMPIFPQWRLLSYAWDSSWARSTKLVMVSIIAWPWGTIAALMVFQLSMAKAKVKPMHVVRCVIYSADAAGLLLLALLPSVLSNWRRGFWRNSLLSRVDEIWLTEVALLLAGVALTYRLWIAYRKYLRFDHALATAAASQVMVGLLVWKFALDWHVLGW